MLKLMPKKAWSFEEHEFIGMFSLLSVFSTVIHPMSWKMMMTESIRKPQYVGQYAHGRRPFRVWLYKTRVWISDHQVTMTAFEKQGKRIRPRYIPEEQWWWDSIDESMREQYLWMECHGLGIKPSVRSKTARRYARGVGTKDGRYIPQWVKILVVQRDGGRCVYCSESDPRLLEFDHRLAYIKGGSSTDPNNICLGCKRCNRKKGADDWGWG